MRPGRIGRFGRATVLAIGLLAAGCATLPAQRTLSCSDAPAPRIQISEDGRTARTRLDVLTYNIEGLGWPARRGRAADLAEIGRRLAQLRATGAGPDIVLFQEVFSRPAVAAVEAAGYPALVAGPGRRTRRDLPSFGKPPGRRSWINGEIGLRLATGGLAIASIYPIVDHAGEPFGRRGCAGLDCLSNKGALHARIAIPGVPAAVDVFDTHMNSRRASRASSRRTLAAHVIQTAELSMFLSGRDDAQDPNILGGDFNMRGSEARFEVFDGLLPMQLVQRYCAQRRDLCDVKASWDGDEPWMDTQDLQLFEDGRAVAIRPIRIEAMFDGRPDSPSLSDHDGLRVVYELSWPASQTRPAGGCAG
ncbi:MAG: endonuclease/exonuclease/phosphatase family protein [Alphaproteobacteria bacterium]|nr:endonuclease/exonuclease/phosphatase family protein [Alphaproteobacteria bacterium]MBU1514703.1 endonuclease/exonuclease/phosphatase family protein [Alphaproteobacteria bacterium]MBU2093562.1 endonuclease/exonuclease/phosphatase family protein [Alphaproteobacteria bacterium]MBU2149476.1 endonuclease/exonuclease/phosphatase family protein [Alphaproteobacteria bacterium]MBU2305481.1 endonuclease/exonuclease/phosphatase family protein [Alphaproteobacteria bacterium]